MKIEIDSTEKIVTLNIDGAQVPARVWQGKSEKGIEVVCFITRVLVAEGQPAEAYQQFEADLKEHAKARPAVEAIPLRLVL